MSDGDDGGNRDRATEDGNAPGNRDRATDDGDDGGERILNIVGVVLVGFLVVAVGVLVLAGGFIAGGGAESPDLPEVNWTAERVNETHVRLVHDGGEPVQTDDLIVVVGKTDRGIRTRNVLVQGESFTVAAQEGLSVTLYWKPEDQQRRTLFREWDAIDDGG